MHGGGTPLSDLFQTRDYKHLMLDQMGIIVAAVIYKNKLSNLIRPSTS